MNILFMHTARNSFTVVKILVPYSAQFAAMLANVTAVLLSKNHTRWYDNFLTTFKMTRNFLTAKHVCSLRKIEVAPIIAILLLQTIASTLINLNRDFSCSNWRLRLKLINIESTVKKPILYIFIIVSINTFVYIDSSPRRLYKDRPMRDTRSADNIVWIISRNEDR